MTRTGAVTPRIERFVLPSGRVVLIETRHYKDFGTVGYRLAREGTRRRTPAKRKARKT